jgi:L-amino acid N-acyltransferase YncA
MEVRPLLSSDWPAVLAAYEEGLATGQATFETTAPTWDQWDAAHSQRARLVATSDDTVYGWAALTTVSRRKVYSGVAEVSVYIRSEARGRGIGRLLLTSLIAESEAAGIWTLQASIFPENTASVGLCLSCGFREVGRRERIARHAGVWRDTVLLERRSSAI